MVVKGYVASKTKSFKSDKIQNLTKEAIDQIAYQNRKNYVEHIIKIERDMWEMDNLF